MERATANEAKARYNDEVLFLDGIIETHPEVYNSLSPSEQSILREYYLIGAEEIPNILVYRNNLLKRKPGIAQEARAVFEKVLRHLDMQNFTYTTRADH